MLCVCLKQLECFSQSRDLGKRPDGAGERGVALRGVNSSTPAKEKELHQCNHPTTAIRVRRLVSNTHVATNETLYFAT